MKRTIAKYVFLLHFSLFSAFAGFDGILCLCEESAIEIRGNESDCCECADEPVAFPAFASPLAAVCETEDCCASCFDIQVTVSRPDVQIARSKSIHLDSRSLCTAVLPAMPSEHSLLVSGSYSLLDAPVFSPPVKALETHSLLI